jgi:xanthine dehydrogenase small subunit
MVDRLGSQCGYCTPGFVMSLFEAHHRRDLDAAWKLDDQVCGNLCRCTGYRPIKQALCDTAGTAVTPMPAARTALPTRADTFHYQADGAHFVAPRNLQDALEILAAMPDARIVAGATDVGLQVTQGRQRFGGLLSVEHLPGLRGITETQDGWRIGAATDLVTLEDWSAHALPLLHRMLRYFGSRQIKHRATLGGNLCNASPIGDTPPVLLALDAVAVIAGLGVGGTVERRVPLSAFFTGYRATALRTGELLVAIEVPAPSADARTGAYKVSRRREMDISAVSAAFRLDLDGDRIRDARVAYGGVAATPVRLHEVEALLRGATWNDAVAEEAATMAAATVQPMTDHRGTADFRRILVRNLLLGFREETRDAGFRALPSGHCGTVVLDGDAAGDAR